MWKLVPGSWFNRNNPVERRHAEAVELLQECWRGWLAAALCRVVGDELQEDIAVRLVPSLSGDELLNLDEALRIGHHWYDYATPSRRPASLTEIISDSEAATAYLFTASCNVNGFVRERALDALRHYPGRLAVAAALIRCDDWVAPVRAAATRLLGAVTQRHSPEILIEHLDLLVRLRARHRFGEGAWVASVFPQLGSQRCRGRLWQWAEEGPWQVRKFALELIASAEPELRNQAAVKAIQDQDARVALWGLAQLRVEHALSQEGTLTVLIHHPAASVRAAAVRTTSEVDQSLARSIIDVALFDVSREPRSAAAYALEHRFSQSPLQIWRTAFRGSHGKRRRAALFGLCDRGAPEDVPLIATAAQDPNALVRATALQGLFRAHADDLGGHLEQALSDRGRLVVQQALNIYERSSEPLASQALAKAIASARDVTLRSLAKGSRLIDRWQGLELLLSLATSERSEHKKVALNEIRHWIGSSHRRFTAPSAAMTQSIQRLLHNLRTAEPADLWRQLSEIVGRT